MGSTDPLPEPEHSDGPEVPATDAAESFSGNPPYGPDKIDDDGVVNLLAL